eukprot:SAG25_NODE_2337_length_1702_cov_1.232689_2_plen_65_part_00
MLVSAHSDGRLKLWDVSRSAGVTSSYDDDDNDRDDDGWTRVCGRLGGADCGCGNAFTCWKLPKT